MSTFAVILPAAGGSRRFRDKHFQSQSQNQLGDIQRPETMALSSSFETCKKKPFAPLGGRAVWLHSAERFLNRQDVKQVIVVVADEDREEFNRKFGANIAILGIQVCSGGAKRSDSIQNALAMVEDGIELVAVHDAARPCLADKWIDAVFAAAAKDGAAILAVPVPGTLKQVDGNKQIEKTVDRTNLWEAQTPQVFRRDLLAKAYAARAGQSATDDAQLVEQLGQRVTVVEGSPLNLKITTRDDLKLAELVLKNSDFGMRIAD